MNIHFSLKNLFLSESICSKLKELDISNSGMNDNGMLRLAKNISALKEIKLTEINKKLYHFFYIRNISINL